MNPMETMDENCVAPAVAAASTEEIQSGRWPPSTNPFSPTTPTSPGNPFMVPSAATDTREVPSMVTQFQPTWSANFLDPFASGLDGDLPSSSSTADHLEPQTIDMAYHQGEVQWGSGGVDGGKDIHNDEETEDSANGVQNGFSDDFSTMTQTEVMFNTGLRDDFKAVGVTAEEDDLWSSLCLEDPPGAKHEVESRFGSDTRESNQSPFIESETSHRLPTSNLEQSPASSDLEINHGVHSPSSVPDPWRSNEPGSLEHDENPPSSHLVQSPTHGDFDKTNDAEDSQDFVADSNDPWPSTFPLPNQQHKECKDEREPESQLKNNQESEGIPSSSNPFKNISVNQISEGNQPPDVEQGPDFLWLHKAAGFDELISEDNLMQIDIPSTISPGDDTKLCRSPNPFSPGTLSVNPFLQHVQEVDLLTAKWKSDVTEHNQIPDIPKFEEAETDPKAGTSAEGEDMEAAASLEPRLSSSATDTHDVAEHDNLFDLSGTAADLDHTNDEFENNERLMQEEEERLHSQEQVEVEDIFQSDQEGADPEAFTSPEANGTHNEMEDIFKDDVKNMSHDFEPIFQTEMPDYDPVEMDSRDTLNSHPEMSVEDLDTEGDVPADAQIGCHANDLPFPDVPSKSDIVLDWEEEDKAVSPTPPLGMETSAVAPPSLLPQQDDEIDEGEVAKFVENILISSAREVYSMDSEQECADKVESEPVEQESAAEVITVETTVESEHALCQEKGLEEAVVHAVCEPEEKESLSVSVDTLLPESVIDSKVSTDAECDEDKMDSVPAVPASMGDITAEEAPKTNIVETLDIKNPEQQTFDSPAEAEPIAVSPKTAESHESPSRKMSVPKPRDIRRDLSFFGSGSSSGKSFMSNTLPRVSVLPRISTTYQRKSPLSPSSDMDSFDKSTEELPMIPKPDLSAGKSPVIAELDAVELPHIETLSTAPVVPPVKSAESVVPVSETKVESSPTVMSPVYASAGVTQEPIYLDGSSPEEIEAIFNKDPEEEKPAKKSMAKSDVLASTRVRKVSRNTWKGQEEFQKSVEKSKIILDEPQAASLRRYEERKKQRQGAFIRSRQDSTSEAESEGSQSSTPRTTPKMPDVVQSGESGARDGEAQSEIVQPKLNMKSVRSLWEQKAAEVEQRRRSLQTKTRPVSHGERARSSSTRAINKSSDNIDSLDDSIEGNTSFSYDGLSDDSSSKRESLIERDIRLQKEREREISKERERLRSESTSSRDESQPSETSENPDDQVVDIVRDTEMRRDSDDGRSSPSQSSGYTSGRSTPSMPADDILKIKSGKGGKMPDLKMSLSPSDPDAQSNYREYQKMLRGNKTDGKFSKSATFPRRMESNFETQASSSGGSLAISVGDVPDVIMVDGMNSSTTTSEKTRKTSIVQQGIKLSQTLEKKKVAKVEPKPRRSLMDMEIQAQREKEEAFRREQQTRKLSGTTSPLPSPQDEAKPDSTSGSTSSSSATSPATTPQGSPRKTSMSGQPAKSVYKDLNYVPKTNKKKLALAEHWEHKWK